MTTDTTYPSVLLIYTGGTIGMIRNSETGALESFTFDHLVRHIPELKQMQCHIDSVQFDPPIDSSDMDPSLWVDLARIIHDNYDRYDGFVVLHGSDTMSYTASAMSFALENLDKPVIFTGQPTGPSGVLRTDGKEKSYYRYRNRNRQTSRRDTDGTRGMHSLSRPVIARQPNDKGKCREFQRVQIT